MTDKSVTAKIMQLSRGELDVLRLKALDEGKDFHSLVASKVTGIAYDHIDEKTRTEAKLVLFGFLYGRNG